MCIRDRYLIAAFVTPYFWEYLIRDCLNSIVCVILFIADRIPPYMLLCSDSTVTQRFLIRYYFLIMANISSSAVELVRKLVRVFHKSIARVTHLL